MGQGISWPVTVDCYDWKRSQKMSDNEKCMCKRTAAMAEFAAQEWCEPYSLNEALEEGTVFPNLNLPFFKADKGTSTLKKCCQEAAQGEEGKREKMMCEINTVSFALNDLTLYLDTHPDCPKGLSLFKELLSERLRLLSEFAQLFYPLTQISMIMGEKPYESYGWGEGPMPWEGGCI